MQELVVMMKDVKILKCCGEQMKINIETPLYYELHCKKCGDVIYLRKGTTPKPQLIDD
jgi:hypothetical protein